MKRRFQAGCWLAAVAALLLAGGGVWWFLHSKSGKDADDASDKKTAQIAPVQVAALRRGPIERTLVAYGTAVAAPGATRSLSFPFECRVAAVRANVGQPVQAGDVLLRIEPSADARLALDTARATRDAAATALKDARARFRAHLATNTDLAAAESASRDADLKLQSLQGRLPAPDGNVPAPAAGLVTAIPVRPGAVVPAGGPLVELAVENRLEARLGIAPPDAAQVHSGQSVHLTPVESRAQGNAAALAGTVRVVGQSVDAATRLVDGFVAFDPAPDAAAPVMVGAYLRAEIVVETRQTLLAPREAVLPDAGHPGRAALFTIQSGKAVRHEVGTGITDGARVELTDGAGALADGAKVVTQGAYELEDGMAVEVGPLAGANPDAEGSAP